jgi:hypothetical protein
VREDEMGRACNAHGSEDEFIYDFGGKARRPRRRWKDNIRMDLRVIEWGGRDWIDLSQDRDQWRAPVNTVMNLRIP